MAPLHHVIPVLKCEMIDCHRTQPYGNDDLMTLDQGDGATFPEMLRFVPEDDCMSTHAIADPVLRARLEEPEPGPAMYYHDLLQSLTMNFSTTTTPSCTASIGTIHALTGPAPVVVKTYSAHNALPLLLG